MWSSPERSPSRGRRPPARGGLLVCLALLGPVVHAQADAHDPLRVDDVIDVPSVLLAAERGDPRAAFLLGSRYASGRGSVRDDSEARRWFEVAAQGGLAEAQYNLALLMDAGRGGRRDAAGALRWYEAAAEQGLAPAQFNAAMLLLAGAPDAPRDAGRAADWLRRAAERGLAPAQYNLGVLREFGRGVPRDPGAAQVWYRRAASQGYEPARERLAALAGDAAAAGPRATHAATSAARTAAEPASPSPPRVAGAAGRANEWVLARDPGRYTLQLLSLRDEAGVREYLERHGIDDEGGYFHSRSEGKDWYSVVYGDYASHAEATAAAAALPKSLGIDEPWVRNLGAIRKALAP